MDRDQQIEEMQKTLCEGLKPLKETYGTDEIVSILYDSGYRKASEVVNEFSEKLIQCFNDMEYNASTPRKTVKIDELREQMDWILHDVVIKTIKQTAKEIQVLSEVNIYEQET